MSDTRAINSIIVGERHRRDMGDIDGLAASIEAVGLLTRSSFRPSTSLIAGERRFAPCGRSGWRRFRSDVVDLAEIVRGELAENTDRKDFRPSERGHPRGAASEGEGSREGTGSATDHPRVLHDPAALCSGILARRQHPVPRA